MEDVASVEALPSQVSQLEWQPAWVLVQQSLWGPGLQCKQGATVAPPVQ